MKRIIFASILLLGSNLAHAGSPPGIPMGALGNANGVAQLDASKNVPLDNLNYAQSKIVPVCNNTRWNTNAGGTAGNTADSRIVLYCPNGFSRLQLAFSGVYLLPGEFDLGNSVTMSVGVEAPIPAPWSSSGSYSAGQSVTYLGNYTTNNSPNWQATATNKNSAPSPSNTNWETSPSSNPLYLATCGGTPTCTLSAQTTGPGAAVTQGYLLTDPIPVMCQVGCFISIRIHSYVDSTSHLLSSAMSNQFLGEYLIAGSATTDRTTTASAYGPPQGVNSGSISPVAALGIPLVNKPTVCVIGDSRAAGVVGYGVYTITISSGGSGYTSADVGDVLSIPTSGASSGAVAVPATLIIGSVTNGAVTSVKLVTTGSFTDPGSNSTQTLPSSTQTIVGGSGSGLALSVTYHNPAYDPGDYYGANGMINRGLSEAGIAYAPFEVSGDKIYYWINLRDYTRINMIAQSGCSSAIIALGINDVTSGYTADQIEGWYESLASQLNGVGVRNVFLVTIPTADTSTNGFTTTAGQTPRSGVNTVRVSVNDWIRTNPEGFSGYFEAANAVESAQNSSAWKASSTACYYTCDGTHATPIGDAAIAAVISANAGILQ